MTLRLALFVSPAVSDAVTDIVVVRPTSTLLADEVDVAKIESPLYVATMFWLPIGKEFVVSVAWPELTVTEPRVDVPKEKVMDPEGEPVPDMGETRAVNVTGAFSVGVEDDVESVVAVAIKLA